MSVVAATIPVNASGNRMDAWFQCSSCIPARMAAIRFPGFTAIRGP
jgi:hypothetical protein